MRFQKRTLCHKVTKWLKIDCNNRMKPTMFTFNQNYYAKAMDCNTA